MQAIQLVPLSPVQLETLAFTPSPASFTAMPSTCVPAGAQFTLAAVDRSLPVLGGTLHTRISGATVNGLLIAGLDYPSGTLVPTGCGCTIELTMSMVTLFIPNNGGTGDWLLPIVTNPALFNIALDMQVFLFDSSLSCGSLPPGTNRGRAVIGG